MEYFPPLSCSHFLSDAVIVTAMLILGGAATVTALCGMNVFAASFLIPLSAVPFTMHGAAPPTRSRLANSLLHLFSFFCHDYTVSSIGTPPFSRRAARQAV